MGMERVLEWGSDAESPTEKTADFGARGAPAARIVLRLEETKFDFGAIISLNIYATGEHVKDPDQPLRLDPTRNQRKLLADANQSIEMVLQHAETTLANREGDPHAKSDVAAPVAALHALQQAITAAESSRSPTQLKRALADAVGSRTNLVQRPTSQDAKVRLQEMNQLITRAHALVFELEQKDAGGNDEQTASSSEEHSQEPAAPKGLALGQNLSDFKVFRTPADAPAAFLDDIYEFLEGEIEHAGAHDETEVSEYQEMLERMHEGQRFASEQWDAWFEKTIQEIQDHLHGHHSHTDESEDDDA